MNSDAANPPQATATAPPQPTPDSPPRFLFSLLFLAWLAVVLVTVLVTFILPETYSSAARIKIERDVSDIAGLSERPVSLGYDPYFMQTEFETIQSELVLGKVIDLLDLNTVWGKKYDNGERLKTDESMRLLKGKMILRPVRNTSLLEITVYSEDKDEAAKIANTIAEAYKDYRQNQLRRMTQGGVKALEEKYDEQQMKIQKVQAQLAGLAREPSPQNSNRWDNLKSELDHLQEFGRTLYLKIASEKVDLALPKTMMVEILDQAVPGRYPVRPNKPLNIFLGLVLGGLVGLFMATLVHLLQRRLYRRRSGVRGTPTPRWFRNILHVIIALVVGIVFGYAFATNFSFGSLFLMQFSVVLGGIAFALIELAKFPADGTAPAGNELTKAPNHPSKLSQSRCRNVGKCCLIFSQYIDSIRWLGIRRGGPGLSRP